MTLSRWHLHSHAQEIFRHCGLGSVKFRWVIGTSPAVSLPELHTVRKTLGKPGLILVVSDASLTETDELADLVLPAALWGEKTGRQVAGQVGGRGRAFKAWARHTRGWFCDHSGLTYEKLSAGTGVHWPCNAHHPDGTERIDTDLRFKTAAAECETFGHDLETGAPVSPNQYAAHGPAGRAGDPQAGTLCLAAGGAGPRAPALPDHRAGGVPLPHPDQHRPVRGPECGRSRTVR